MGCSSSVVARRGEVARSRESKRRAEIAVRSGDSWKVAWIRFAEGMEKAGMAGALWVEDEMNPSMAASFRTTSKLATTFPIHSRSFAEAVDTHLSTLETIAALEREHYASVKALARFEIDRARGNRSIDPGGRAAANAQSPMAAEPISARAEADNRSKVLTDAANLVAAKRDCTGTLRAVVEAQAEMWKKLKCVFAQMRAACESSDWWATSEDGALMMDTGSPLGVEAEAAAAAEEGVAVRDRIRDIAKWTVLLGRCLTAWNEVGKLEAEHVLNLQEWWTNEWEASSISDPASATEGATASASAPPPHLALVQAWDSSLSEPSPAFTIRHEFATDLNSLKQLLNQIRKRELQVQDQQLAVSKAGRAAARAARRLSRGSTNRVGPEPAPSSSSSPTRVMCPTAKSHLSKRLHTLDAAQYRLDRTLRDNREFRREGLGRASVALWSRGEACAKIMGTA
ncbi:hypothetical protein BDK51DRAFT_45525, partial [Blyttiomyces helicus]